MIIRPASDLVIAEENNQIVGSGKLIEHPDCVELSSLEVIKIKQGKGVGSALVKALIKKAGNRPLYLTTIVPEFFEKLGFKKISSYPESIAKKDDYCEGCQPEKCAVMKYEHS